MNKQGWKRRFVYWHAKARTLETELLIEQIKNRHLLQQNKQLAGWLMSEWVHVYTSKVEEVDKLLEPYFGGSDVWEE